MKRFVYFLLLASSLSSHSMSANTDSPIAEHRGDILFASQLCNGTSEGTHARLVTSQEQLAAVYAQLQSNTLGAQHPVPVMDFSKETILFMEMGQQPTSGYQLAFDSRKPIQVYGDHMQITVTWLEPEKGAITAQMITTPCVLVRFPMGEYPAIRVLDQNGKQRYPAGS